LNKPIIPRIEEAVFKAMDNGKVSHMCLNFDDYGALCLTGDSGLYVADGKPEFMGIPLRRTQSGNDRSFVMKMDKTREYL
jgi:hypothetical protein